VCGGERDRENVTGPYKERVQARRSRSALRANQTGEGQARRCLANAGIPNLAPFGKITEEQYDSVFNGNVKGLLFTVQKALPLLPDGASIILNASIVASKGLPDWSVYSATKAAVRSFARTWTTDLKDRRIRVNAVSPGLPTRPHGIP